MIPQADPRRRFEDKRAAIRRAIDRVFDRGLFILGEEVERFEHEFADYLGSGYVVGVSSGTDALSLALSALGIGRGDEVITPSLTFAATAIAVEDAGAVPVFVDVDRAGRCIDPGQLASAIGPKTAAIIPVHLHGFPAPMSEIMQIADRNKLFVVEDCAQAHGAKIGQRSVGTFGHAAAFSFYPTKNLGAAGDAGAVATGDRALAERLRKLRNYGWDESRISVGPGSNRRMDELQAAILRVLLPYLDAENAARTVIAKKYRSELTGFAVGLPPDDEGAVYHQFAITIDRRDELRALLRACGIETGIHYPVGVHRHPRFLRPDLLLPVTDKLAASLLSLPIQPEIARDRVAEICQSLLGSMQRQK